MANGAAKGKPVITLAHVKKLTVWVLAGFLLLSFWGDPSGSADVFTDFIGSVGRFFSDVIDKLVAFFQRLAD